jgi:peptidyl-dipeptidase Dcp
MIIARRALRSALMSIIVSSSAVQPGLPASGQSVSNPLLSEWATPFGVPPFGEIKEEHFIPAVKAAMARQQEEIAALLAIAEPPTFANTIEALESSGYLLDRVNAVFSNLTGADTNPKRQAIAKELAPLQAAHRDSIVLNDALFKRVKSVWESRPELKLNPEQQMLLEKAYKRFVRGGALLDPAGKDRLRANNAELASLGFRFSDNLLKEMNAFQVVVDKPSDLAGLPEQVRASAASAAAKASMEGKWMFTLHAPSLWPFLQYSEVRELREKLFKGYLGRGNKGGETDNNAVASRMASLRSEKAGLLGYNTWADFEVEEKMSKTPARVYELLNRLWEPAKALAASEAAAMQEMIKAEGKDFELQPWDWFYYAEKIRKARYELDEDAVRPYFPLEQVRDGAFKVATRLYGITFTELKDIPVYNAEVKVFEVKDSDGSHLALFFVDYHPRPGKRSGAWCSSLRTACTRDGKTIRPLVLNTCNFSRPAGETPALLTFDEVETLFHEFGHALHGMLSRIHYRSLASTPTDYVELPSQIMENWAMDPEVLQTYARHWKTGEVIPAPLVEKMKKAELFNQGFKTVEYLAASLLDMEWHTLSGAGLPDTETVERIALARMGMPKQIVPRYRSTYFQHIFSGGYSAGYYSYIWAEVLDADAFRAFEEKGIFDPATALSFRRNILEKGHSEEPMVLYERFRGRSPEIGPLLKKRGLDQAVVTVAP